MHYHVKGIRTGTAIVLKAGKLKHKGVIHVVGPNFSKCETVKQRETAEHLLRRSIFNVLDAAANVNMSSVVMPAISTGIFGGDCRSCMRIILESCIKWA